MIDKLSEYIAYLENRLKNEFFQQISTEELILRNKGWDLNKYEVLRQLPTNFHEIRQTDIDTLGGEYFPYPVLLKFKKYREFPLDFVNIGLAEVEQQEPMSGDYTVVDYGWIKVKSKKSEDNIRLVRLDEVLGLVDKQYLSDILGEKKDDGTFTELEIMGIIGLITVIQPPVRFMEEVWKTSILNSNNGITLRKYLKVWSTSIKRWPDYWTQRYNCEIEKIIETETVLGYLIEDTPQAYHMRMVDRLLEKKTIYYDRPFDEFLIDVKQALATGFDDGRVEYVKELGLVDYLNNWNNWTTAGSAPEYRIQARDGKLIRINKSALPLVTTIDDVLSHADISASVVYKAEVGKNRPAYSTCTKNILVGGYLLDKYSSVLQDARTTANYITYSNQERLKFALDLLTVEEKMGVMTADIEENDINHIPVFNCLLLFYRLSKILLPEDRDLLYQFLKDKEYNIIRIPTTVVKNTGYLFKARVYDVKGQYTYYIGDGGEKSGEKDTFDTNSLNNYVTDYLASRVALRIDNSLQLFPAIVGGDDKTGLVKTIKAAAICMLANTGIYLPISANKSYISYTTGEFFRIMYIRGRRRQGYPSRVIHSIISSNPASSQELDIINAFKAYWSNCSQIQRRGGDHDTLVSWFRTYVAAKGIPFEVISVATENGGCGIPVHPTNIWDHVKPGIPRYKRIKKEYNIQDKWFKDIMINLRVNNIPGVPDSYFEDMLTGVRDRENRSDSRKQYKEQLDRWKKNYVLVRGDGIRGLLPETLIKRCEPVKNYFNSRSAVHYVLDNILNLVADYKNAGAQYFKVKGEYQLYSDILNRGKFDKFRDKLTMLTGVGVLFIADNFRNTKTAYTLSTLLNNQLALTSPVDFSFPADMSFLYLDMSTYLLGPVRIHSPSEFVWFSDFIRFTVAEGFMPYLDWATRW